MAAAADYGQAAVELDPQNWKAMLDSCRILLESGDAEPAHAAARRAAAIAPDVTGVDRLLAHSAHLMTSVQP